jgi:chromosome segregation ATPase
LQSENRFLQASNAKLKTALQKQDAYQTTVKAEFNKLFETRFQEVKSQYNTQLEEVKSQYESQLEELGYKHQSLKDQLSSILSSQQIRNQAPSDELPVMREHVRGLTALLGNLVMHLELQDANEW